MRLNNLESRVAAANCSLGVAAGSAELLAPGPLTMGGSLRPEWSSDAAAMRLTVELKTVDRVVQALGIDRIDLFKLDVEGFELDVLQGARENAENR